MEKSTNVEDAPVQKYDTEFDWRQSRDRYDGNYPRVLIGAVSTPNRVAGNGERSRTSTFGPSLHDLIRPPVIGFIVESRPKRPLLLPFPQVRSSEAMQTYKREEALKAHLPSSMTPATPQSPSFNKPSGLLYADAGRKTHQASECSPVVYAEFLLLHTAHVVASADGEG